MSGRSSPSGWECDAKVLADEFFPEFSVEDLIGVPIVPIQSGHDQRSSIVQGFSALTLSL